MTMDKIEDIVIRLERLEDAVFSRKKKQKTPSPNSQNNFTGPKGGILLLVENSFFKTPHTAPEAKTAMEENGYHYSIQAVQTALKRLSSQTGPLTAMKEGKNKVYVRRK